MQFNSNDENWWLKCVETRQQPSRMIAQTNAVTSRQWKKKLQLVSGDTESKSFLTFNFTSFNMLLSLKFSVTLARYSSANPWLVHSPVGPDCCWFSKVYIPFSDCRLRFYRKKPVALARSSKVRQINTARESKQKQVINTKWDGKALTRSCVWTEQLRHRARMQFTYTPSP